MIQRRNPLLCLRGIGMERAGRTLFAGLCLRVGSLDRVVGLIGASGSGKTTLLHLVAGLERPRGGWVEVDGRYVPQHGGRALREHLGRTALVLQSWNLVEHLSVEENVALPLLLRGWSHADALPVARSALRRFGLHEHGQRLPAEVSGGEAQRAAVARAIASGAPLILADEPTAALDSACEQEVFSALRSAALQHGRTVLIASHSERIERYCDRVLELREGRLVERMPDFVEPLAPPARAQLALVFGDSMAGPARGIRRRRKQR